MRITILILAFTALLSGCNRNDLNTLHDIADDHTKRLERLEQVVIDGQRQLDVIHTLLLEYERRIQISGTETLPEGGYVIRFTDGDSVVINDAISPVVTISTDSTWIINDRDTGIKATGRDGVSAIAPQVRTNNEIWEISTDNGQTWTSTGVPSKGDTGENAIAPTIAIGANGNWFIGGEDSGQKAIGTDGKIITDAPQIEARLNTDGSANWWIRNGDEAWSDTGIMAMGRKGDAGADNQSPYITHVTVSGADVTFVFSRIIPGSNPPTNTITVERTLPFRFEIKENGVWVTVLSKPLPVPVDGVFHSYECRVISVTGKTMTVKVLSAPGGFNAQEAFSNNILWIGAESDIGGYYSGSIILQFTNELKESYTVAIPVETQVFRLDVANFIFGNSHIYNVFDLSGVKIAEVCNEYLSDRYPQTVVIYPFDATTLRRSAGYAIKTGGTVDPHTSRYDPDGGLPARRSYLYLLNGTTFLPVDADYPQATLIPQTNFIAETVTDIDGNRYKTVKIGTQYWMQEDLRTTRYNTGDAVGEQATYSLTSMQDGRLAPAGWHIPSDEEWKTMEMFMGMTEEEADKSGIRTMREQDLFETSSGWWSRTPATGGSWSRSIDASGISRIPFSEPLHVRCIRDRR